MKNERKKRDVRGLSYSFLLLIDWEYYLFIVIFCVIDLVSLLFARFNVTSFFYNAVKRSVPPSALYVYVMLCSLKILDVHFCATTRRFFELLFRRGAYRYLFRLQADSGRFVISTLCCAHNVSARL